MDILSLKPPNIPNPSTFLHKPSKSYIFLSPAIKISTPNNKMLLQCNPSPSSFRGTPLSSRFPNLTKKRNKKQVLTPKAEALGDVEMVKNGQGTYTAKQNKVVVLWDLDNKPPRGPPYQAAMALKEIAQRFGDLVDISAYANRHAFIHLPQWVLEQRRERKQMDILERKGQISPPSSAYICGVCGRKCRTNLDLKKHFKQLHERERQKKLGRMRCLRGKKRQKYKERFISGNHKYEESARALITPKIGYGLASELRRAGVFVKTVEDKPQAADSALKRQMMHSMSRGIDWLLLVSDDSDFADMILRARDSNMRTVVVGDGQTALGRHADIWVPWIRVENGEAVDDDILMRDDRYLERDDGFFSSTNFSDEIDDESDGEFIVGDVVVKSSEVGRIVTSAFSEEEQWVTENDYALDSDEDDREDDDYF